MLKIQEVKTTPSLELFSELVELLQETVSDGASIGFLTAPATKDARNYWTGILEQVGRGERRLFVATDDHVCAGSVQLVRPQKANATHRGEVQKLMVNTQFRRRGIGSALINALEKAAIDDGLTLLVLDTRSGDPAERLYSKLHWKAVGQIPNFARSANGRLEPTTVFYRELPSVPGEF